MKWGSTGLTLLLAPALAYGQHPDQVMIEATVDGVTYERTMNAHPRPGIPPVRRDKNGDMLFHQEDAGACATWDMRITGNGYEITCKDARGTVYTYKKIYTNYHASAQGFPQNLPTMCIAEVNGTTYKEPGCNNKVDRHAYLSSMQNGKRKPSKRTLDAKLRRIKKRVNWKRADSQLRWYHRSERRKQGKIAKNRS